VSKILVSTEHCTGVGYCQRVAPTLFALGVKPPTNVRNDTPVGDELRLALEAATLCPTSAITVVEL
jgi:ferredoxin